MHKLLRHHRHELLFLLLESLRFVLCLILETFLYNIQVPIILNALLSEELIEAKRYLHQANVLHLNWEEGAVADLRVSVKLIDVLPYVQEVPNELLTLYILRDLLLIDDNNLALNQSFNQFLLFDAEVLLRTSDDLLLQEPLDLSKIEVAVHVQLCLDRGVVGEEL